MNSIFRLTLGLAVACLSNLPVSAAPTSPTTETHAVIKAAELNQHLHIGDLVFIQVGVLPFMKISSATGSWVNHVGVVVDVSGSEALIAESTVPFSRITPLARFASRSKNSRFAVARLNSPLTIEQQVTLKKAANKRLGIAYDTGFDLHSLRMFCSKFSREVLVEATGIAVGEIETLRSLFNANATIDLSFWRVWYLGNIPWERETVTPASMFNSQKLHHVFDGYVLAQ